MKFYVKQKNDKYIISCDTYVNMHLYLFLLNVNYDDYFKLMVEEYGALKERVVSDVYSNSYYYKLYWNNESDAKRAVDWINEIETFNVLSGGAKFKLYDYQYEMYDNLNKLFKR